MRKSDFESIVKSQPGLTAKGFMSPLSPDYGRARQDFMNSAHYLQHTIDAMSVLVRFKPTVLMTKWQKENCTPLNLRGLIEWHCGRTVSIGAIIVAALALGFRVEYSPQGEACFNIFARQLEGELRDFRVRELIKQAVGH
ncbi:hypothetical protein [Pseudobacteriovorax antillogorgiicola]|uniref:Uncharacterized protein n=1 Tax=Pseudobacteriovorax antillogorgiicola TaxID=1513793 RepID=A0A1Y6CMM0_9BACT|nr:hypothetical protein [Pseudobacteriovorax antillogorgiicola]TCS44585.1 hypothetical protein EDD56_13218 [Pseudobacteriovorax antillogorgiicola]SMF78053.1 hypothetical protein SAMN06296036_13218 [Pseudobacteriovorax antillogorgiicola]